jgi:hypothetical protein
MFIQLNLFDQITRLKRKSSMYVACSTEGCTNLQNNRDGKCAQCRTLPCIECKRPYTRIKGLVRCWDCNTRHRRKISVWA